MNKGIFTSNLIKTLCIIALSLFFYSTSEASTAQVTSLEELFKAADTTRSSDPKAFNQYLGEIKRSSDSLTQQQQELLWFYESYAKAYSGNYEGAINDLKSLIESSNSKLMKFRVRTSLVNIFYITRNYQESISNVQTLIQQLPEIEDAEIRQLGLMAIIMTYKGFKKHELASEYADKLMKEKPQGRNLCFAKQLKIESTQQIQPKNISEHMVQEAITQCEAVNEMIATSLLRISFARLWLETDPEKSISYLKKYSQHVESTKYPRVIAEYFIVHARALWSAKQTEEAVNKATQALTISQNEAFIQPKVMAYALLYEIEKAAGNFKMALEFYEKYSEADKAQINEILAQEMAYQIVEHQTAEKEQEIKLLNEQNKVLQLEQDLAKKDATNNRLVLALVIVLLATLAFWTYRIKRHQIRLRKQSQTDQLTGLSSRHHFYETAKAILHRSEQEKQDVGFILFDMDYFKSVNDKYGHLVGDWVLQKTAEVVKASCRQNDLAGRLGGEEFAIFLPACNLRKAEQLAEICRKAVSQIDTSETGYRFDVSSSFGVTSTELSGYDFMDLIADADKAMYSAKSKGRNQIVVVDGFVKDFEKLIS
ncbi:tetratricopeptide repeat-containing diguanylate cyclase [Kangiella sp. M94]